MYNESNKKYLEARKAIQ